MDILRGGGRVRIGFSAGLVAALLCASVSFAQPQAPPGGANPGCPPGQLCLGYQPQGRLGRSVDPSEYKYQFHDPYLASITAGAMSPDGLNRGVKREVIHVRVLPGRDNVPMLEGRGEASVALYRQRGAAPLVFVLGGIGSNPYFGLGPYYAALFHKQGAHVVILPSPMSWNFALAASQSGVPGYTPDDARDLYRLMQATLARLRSGYGVEATSVDFLGASLGALEGAYVSVLDEDEGKIGIRRYLLLNPPLDLTYALGKLDEWQALGATLGKERAAKVGLKARGLMEDYIDDRRQSSNASFDRAAREFARFSPEELQFIVAQYIRLVVPELVYVSQAVDDQSLLKAPKGAARNRLQEAKAFSLKDYEEKIAKPRLRRDEEAGDLSAILDRLRANPRVHIMHNADDILVEPTAIAELKKVMGDHMTVYPYGGHLGNLWHAQNREDILRFFGPSSPARLSSPEPTSPVRLSGSASSGQR